MTPTQLTALAAEISTDPAALGYAAHLPDAPGAVCDLMNATTSTKSGVVPTAQFAIWAASTGMRAVIEDKALAAGDPLRSAALTLRDLLAGSMAGLDLSDAANVAGLQVWVTVGALTQENHDALVALAATPASRADVLGLPRVTFDDLVAANVVPAPVMGDQ